MVGPTEVVQPWMPRAARESDAWLCHVSLVGGARRRGCAAAGVPEFFNGLLGRPGARAAVALEALALPAPQPPDVALDLAGLDLAAGEVHVRGGDQPALVALERHPLGEDVV